MHRVDAVVNSSGVRRELAEGIRSLPGWRKGVRQKKTETHRKIIGGSRKACWELSIESGFRRCSGILSESGRRFVEGIRKLTGNMSGDCRKKTIGLATRILKVVELARVRS
ncbi:hypothetical protein GW17_00050392 [Ensete ventricosum]|nr:hypothetical protein GW17_00050392 [Ensete ventricosum]